MVSLPFVLLCASASLAAAKPFYHLRPTIHSAVVKTRSLPLPTERPLIKYDSRPEPNRRDADGGESRRAPITSSPDATGTLQKRDSCTFSGSNGAALASSSQASCATIVLSDVTVPSGEALTLKKLEDGTAVVFEGVTTFEYAEWEGPLVTIQGTDISISGADGAYLDGQGDKYWDGEGSNGGVTKPKFFAAHSLTSSSITNLYLKNSPVQAVSINGADGLTITNLTLDNKAGDALGHNTDAFDIGDSSNVVITGANVYNQDDCVAINSGTSITVENSVCSGGHGLSIGSVGGRDDNTVSGITFSNNVVKNSANGCRIKATAGETGSIANITYENISLQNVTKYGILIEQNYDGGDLHGDPTTGIPITDLTMNTITGDGAVSSSGYNVAIVCGDGSCSDWTWTDVTVSGGKTYGSCENVPSVASC